MTIEERFEKIEKENQALKNQTRSLKRWVAGIGALALAALIGGTALSVRAYTAAIDPLSITTQAITIKDGNNRVRLVLNGDFGAVFGHDAGGKRRFLLDGNTGNITSYDGNGVARAGMSSGGFVRVYDVSGKTRVTLSAPDNKIYFNNSSGGRVAVHP
jgi:hypothetical protein